MASSSEDNNVHRAQAAPAVSETANDEVVAVESVTPYSPAQLEGKKVTFVKKARSG